MHTFKWWDAMYEFLCADGDLLWPVIFSNDPAIPADLDDDMQAIIHHWPHSSGANARMTIAALDEHQDTLWGSHLVLDRGPEFNNAEVLDYCKQHNIVLHFLPAQAGAYFNPCDKSFNSAWHHHYLASPRKTHADALTAIHDSYWNTSVDSVKSYFSHCLLVGPEPTAMRVHHLLSDGYRVKEENVATMERCHRTFRVWSNYRDAVHAHNRHIEAGEGVKARGLDGVYWKMFSPRHQ